MPGPNGERDGGRPRIRRTALVVTVPAAEPLVTDFAATLLEERVDGTWAAAGTFPFGR